MEDTRLREQLRRLGVSRGMEREPVRSRRRGQAIESLLPGELVHTEHGPFFLFKETHELDYRHGHNALSDLLGQSKNSAAQLARDKRFLDVDFRRVAFVDTETTGLAGGTGTYAFMVGVGVFEERQFTINQFFMRDFDEELAMLDSLGELLDSREAVVSFNGKGFDMPLLETRFIMARKEPPLAGAPHLDLLTTARRFWRYRLASCALSSLETEVLGVQRTHEDVPGWLIPSLYLDYARTGDAREMPGIFYHNAQDILSLVTLMARQCWLISTALPAEDSVPGEDLYGLGRMLHDLGDSERAEVAFVQAAVRCEIPVVQEQAMRDLAHMLKRQGRRAEALPWWERLVEHAGAVYACEELAKHYEWHDGDLAQATSWTERGLAMTGRWAAGYERQRATSELEHRLSRLQRKMSEAAPGDESRS